MNRLTIIFIVLLLSACATGSKKTISYYYFDFVKPASELQTDFEKPQLEIKPVILPEYLNIRGMAQRIDQHRTVHANWHLWAAQPAKMLKTTTISYFENLLPQWLVVASDEPWLEANRNTHSTNIKLQFKLERFNGGLDNNAEISGHWTLFDHSNRIIMRQNFTESITLQEDGYGGLATALQTGWQQICQHISWQIEAGSLKTN